MNKEKVWDLERKLLAIAVDIPGIREPIGCSGRDSKGYRDVMISFYHSSSSDEQHTYFLKFEFNKLIAYASGFGYRLPEAVKESITERFPDAEYRRESGFGVDAHHTWSPIEEKDL